MNFFKSVFSDDPDPSNPPGEEEEEEEEEEDRMDDGEAAAGGGWGGGAWSLGGLIKTLASKSESVIHTYRKDLEEFGSGLKKETAAIREAATRAVCELPVSLETGASVAQESLESVGQAIDELGGTVWRGTTEIITHGKEALLSIDSDIDSGDSPDLVPQSTSSSSKRYSRFEAQVVSIQSDPATFNEEPEDGEDFREWNSAFDLAEKEEEIDSICYENGTLEGLFGTLVPGVVDYDTFWSRYYYRVHKLKQAEDARANLVKRAISGDDEEELTWEVDDDDEEGENKEESTKETKEEEKKAKIKDLEEEEKEIKEEIIGTSESVEEKKPTEAELDKKLEVAEAMHDEEPLLVAGKVNADDPTGSDQLLAEAKVEPGESCKDSDFSMVSSQPSMPEEDDLGWDEIEDLGEHDDKKVSGSSGSPIKVDLHKRLSADDDDEDLSWDIDYDDEPAKP